MPSLTEGLEMSSWDDANQILALKKQNQELADSLRKIISEVDAGKVEFRDFGFYSDMNEARARLDRFNKGTQRS